MKTISSSKSLIYFDQNRNSSNIFGNGVEDIRLLLKQHYYNVFYNLYILFSEGPRNKFIPAWQKVIDDEIFLVENTIKKYIGDMVDYDEKDIDDIIKRVTNKFRGNLGEILVEYLAVNGELDCCKGNTYVPVDPDNEEYTDATVISKVTRLPMGIQIKNYSKELISREIFDKARSTADKFVRKAIEDKNEKIEYLSSPHQVIISFTDARAMLEDDFNDSVIFLGPRAIEKIKLQGDKRTKPKSLYFKEIAEEIDKVK